MGNPIVSVIQFMTKDEQDREYMTERIYELSASAFIFSFIFGFFGLIISLNKVIQKIYFWNAFSFFVFLFIFSAICSYLTLSTLTKKNKNKILIDLEIKRKIQNEIDRKKLIERQEKEEKDRLKRLAEIQNKPKPTKEEKPTTINDEFIRNFDMDNSTEGLEVVNFAIRHHKEKQKDEERKQRQEQEEANRQNGGRNDQEDEPTPPEPLYKSEADRLRDMIRKRTK